MKTRNLIWILLACLLLVFMTGCAKEPSPADTVTQFSDAIKAFDLQKMNDYIEGEEAVTSLDLENNETIGGLMNQLKTWSKDLQYKIVSAEEKGDTATVIVEYTHTDASAVTEDAMTDYFTQALAMAFSGASDEDMTELLAKLLTEKAETSEIGTKQTTVVYPLKKIDGKWLIEEIPDDALHVITSDLLRPMLAMGDALSD